jgi:Thioesterase-like superfamily
MTRPSEAGPRAFFVRDDDMFVPTPWARGPWGNTISGNRVGGILGWAIDRDASDHELQPARLTVDLLRPTAMEPVRVQTNVTRDGRRLRLVDAQLTQHGAVVARASALFLRRTEQPPHDVWSSPIAMPPRPTEDESTEDAHMFFHSYGRDPITGSPGIGFTEWEQAYGPKYAWLREVMPLVEGEPLTPFTRAAMAGDVTSSITHWGTGGLKFINADYTLTLSRLPAGALIGLASQDHCAQDGIATGSAAVFDERGKIGSSVSVSLAQSGFRPPAP